MLILEFQTDVNMSSRAYNSFVKILEKWPVDKTKAGKDLGEALRLLFSKTFPSGSSSVVNEKTVNKQIGDLEALISNKTLNSYPRTSKSTFTGLDLETLSQITSGEVLKEASIQSQEKVSFLDKLKNMK